MNQTEAFRETLDRCRADWPESAPDELSLAHQERMLADLVANRNPQTGAGFSEAKIGRWLGWLQGVAAARGLLTLDECKAINRKWADAPATEYQYQWRVSFDGGEIYSHPYDSKDEAAEAARDSGGGLIAECLQEDYDLSVRGSDILEVLEGRNDERVGDAGFIDCTREQEQDLGEMVSASIAAWTAKHAIETTAFMFADARNEERIEGVEKTIAEEIVEGADAS